MRHVKLFLAAATVLFGSVTALWAEPLPASNSTEISTRGLGPSPTIASTDSVTAPAVTPPSPVAEVAAHEGVDGQPQEAKSGPIRHVAPAVVPLRRPAARRARLGCFGSHPSARVAKRAHPRVAEPQARVWLAASREPLCGSLPCSRYVLLGVGY